MQWRNPLRKLTLILAVLCGGCDVAGRVVDRSNIETEVMNMRLSGSGRLKVICGAGIKEVPLEAFESITLIPYEVRTHDGELCFAADITMRDGAKLYGRDKANGNKPLTYVSVNQTLTGTSHRGDFRIDLSGVAKITFH